MIRLEKVDFAYPNGVEVFRDLDFGMREGERLGVIGSNGSGKTTLLHIVMGLLKPSSGKVYLFGRDSYREDDFREARSRIGFVFQDADDQLFCPTVAEDVAFGPRNLGRTQEEARSIVRRTLEMLRIEHLEKRVTYQLSGGEKRLVALATAFAMEPDLIILDEPTTGLTDDASESLCEVLREHAPSLVVVSHDRGFLDRAVDRTVVLKNGKLE